MRRMNVTQSMSNRLELVRKLGLCPSILNLYVERYSFKFLLNDMLSGFKMFLCLFPVAFALAFFCGGSPIQGLISCAVASAISVVLGGSKYQIASLSLPICVLTFEILIKYQYKGLFYTALFVSLILFLFGILKISSILKHISHAFISALSIYAIMLIVINQLQYILGMNSIQSSQSLLENIGLFRENLENMTKDGLLTLGIFMIPIILCKSFFRGTFGFFVYLALGCTVAYVFNAGLVPELFEIKTIGREIITSQSALDTIFTMSGTAPSQTFLSNSINYAFVMALIIACEACFCTNVSASITGDNRLQSNVELISSGISNFVSVALGGMLVSPNINFSVKNIKSKSKTIIPLVVIALLCSVCIYYNDLIMRFLPTYCLSAILLVYGSSELITRKISQYFRTKSRETYIFWITLILALYFGFTSATVVGFAVSCVFFAERMVKIKDANVHTTRNHDSDAVEFMINKNGFMNSLNIPQKLLDQIEVIQVSNILFLNIAKVVEEALTAQGKFPSVLIIYFNNVPYFDNDAFDLLRELVKIAKSKKAVVMISGTNGMLLDILRQKASTEKYNDAFGYIVPDFKTAIQQTVMRLSKTKSSNFVD